MVSVKEKEKSCSVRWSGMMCWWVRLRNEMGDGRETQVRAGRPGAVWGEGGQAAETAAVKALKWDRVHV